MSLEQGSSGPEWLWIRMVLDSAIYVIRICLSPLVILHTLHLLLLQQGNSPTVGQIKVFLS